MLMNRNKRMIGDWPDAERPSYIPKYHLSDFAAIDFEGANGEVTSACSMGIVIVRDDEIMERFYSLMKPVPNKYDFWTTKVHGITYKDTNHAPLFPEVWDQVKDQVRGLRIQISNFIARTWGRSCLCRSWRTTSFRLWPSISGSTLRRTIITRLPMRRRVL